jgi:hypothetical protein
MNAADFYSAAISSREERTAQACINTLTSYEKYCITRRKPDKILSRWYHPVRG